MYYIFYILHKLYKKKKSCLYLNAADWPKQTLDYEL